MSQTPLRIIVPVPAGGTSDLIARMLAEQLRVATAVPVVVDNRAGATGRIAVEALKGATADGNTVLFAPIVIPVIGPLVMRNPGYDPIRDMTPVAQITRYELALAVGADHPARTLREFLDWLRANPARAQFGTPGAGSLPHLLGTLWSNETGLALTHVPYRGVGQLNTDLITGQIAAGISAVSDFVPLHRAAKLRVLVTSGKRRSSQVPDVPTFGDLGWPSLEATGWHGVYAPYGTPQHVVDRLAREFVSALRAPEVKARLEALGLEVAGTTPQELAAIMAADTARWSKIVKSAQISLD